MSGIRRRLVLLLVLAVLPALGFVLWTGWEQRRDLRVQVSEEAARLARIAAAGEGAAVESTRQLLTALARVPQVRTSAPGACQALLASMLEDDRRYANLAVIGRDGMLSCSALEAPAPVYAGDRLYFKRAVSERQFAAGEFQIGRVTKKATINFGYPLLDESGRVDGVVVAALDLSFLGSLISEADLQPGAVLTIFDHRGTILAREPEVEGLVGRQLPETPLVETVLRDREGTADLAGIDGTRRLYGFTTVTVGGSPAFSVAVGVPTAVAYADANRLLTRNLAGIGIVLLLGLAVAWYGGALAGPFRVIAGRRRRPRNLTPTGGLRDVARSFDTITGALDERTEELRRAQGYFRALIEGSHDFISVLDESGAVRYASPSVERALGLAPETVLGRDLLEFVLPADRERLAAALDAARGEPRSGRDVTLRLERNDGGIAVVEATVTNLLADPDVGGLVVNARDVTERQVLERQLQQSQKLEAIGRLAGSIAHDFNNLLTAIRGYGEFALGNAAAGPIRRDLEEIINAAERAATLTHQLLAFSRRQPLEPQVLNLNEVVAEMANLLRRLVGEDIEVMSRLDPDLGNVTADPSQLEQVIANLLVNARDAMPAGGNITIETANVEFDATYARGHAGSTPGPHVMLAVSDTGDGIDPAALDHIFEPFFTTKEEGKGTGLGLATVYGIVKQSGGNIWVYSEPGHGTTFKIYLPRVAADADVAPEPVSSGGDPDDVPTGRAVLLVEDDDGVRDIVRRTLLADGHVVVEAKSRAEAEALFAEQSGAIDLLVTDVVIEDGSGPELAEALRSASSGLRVLLMSGYTDEALARHGIAEAGVPFIEKPFTPSAFSDKVRQILRSS